MKHMALAAAVLKVEREDKVTGTGGLARLVRVQLEGGYSFKLDLDDETAPFVRKGTEIDLEYTHQLPWSVGEGEGVMKGVSLQNPRVASIRKGTLGTCAIEEGIIPNDFEKMTLRPQYAAPVKKEDAGADKDEEEIV